MSAPHPRFFAVKVTVGQERNVARIVDSRITPDFKGIYAILVLPDIRGYILSLIHISEPTRPY